MSDCVVHVSMSQANEILESLVFADSETLDVRNHAEVAKRLQVRRTDCPLMGCA